MLALGEVRGTNQNTSASDFFADASALNVETADLIQGNGSHQGYYTLREGGEPPKVELAQGVQLELRHLELHLDLGLASLHTGGDRTI
jgi:hypothetical protein